MPLLDPNPCCLEPREHASKGLVEATSEPVAGIQSEETSGTTEHLSGDICARMIPPFLQ